MFQVLMDYKIDWFPGERVILFTPAWKLPDLSGKTLMCFFFFFEWETSLRDSRGVNKGN